MPGLEHSTEVDTKAIHRAAATYYAARPASVASDVAEIEEIYHRGFLNDIPDDMTQEQADEVAAQAAGDLEYWPVRARAMVKSLAGRHEQLTEEEVASLEAAQQRLTRGARLEKQLASSDIDSAEFEEEQLELLDDEDETGAAIPDSRWALLFDRGDFDFMTESSRSAQRVRPLLRRRPERSLRRAVRRTSTRGTSRWRSSWSSVASGRSSRMLHWRRSTPSWEESRRTAPPSPRSPEIG